MIGIEKIKFSADGLIPAVVQDYFTNQVLMVAYMNKESLEISLKENHTCFYSRSRKKIWRKGESSGNVQRIVSITADCDFDTLLVRVIKEGPACHTGEESCFFNSVAGTENEFSTDKLYQLIMQRKEQQDSDSYTSYLFREGLDKILKKVGEESTEVVIAAKNQSKSEAVYEISDLYYHTLVLMVNQGIKPEDIIRELASRHISDPDVLDKRGD